MIRCPECGSELAGDRLQCPSCRQDAALWIGRAGQTFGPYSPTDLQQAQAQGRLSPTDQIMIGTDGAWQPLAEVLGGAGAKLPPPPVPAPPPAARPVAGAKSDRSTILVVLVVVGVALVMFVGIFGAILFPVFARAREKARQSSCLSNLKQIELGLLMYCQDYNEKFPPRPRSDMSNNFGAVPVRQPGSTGNTISPYPPGDWRAQIFPYIRNTQVFICPTTMAPDSYSYNDKLYGVGLGGIARPNETVSAFEKGFLDGSARPPHAGMYSVGYADGHCRSQSRTGQPRTAP